MKNIKRILCAVSAMAMLAGCTAAGEEVQTVTCPAEPEETVAVPITTCLADPEETVSEPVTPDYTVEEISGVFDYALLKEISSTEKNTVVSPLSVKLALNMAALGAKNDTEKELLTLFGYEDSRQMQDNSKVLVSELDREDGSITVSNSVWLTEGYEAGANYLGGLGDIFNAETFRQDLSDEKIVDDLNGWIDGKTKGLIPNMISEPFGEDTVMLLVNALYFKNEWEYWFTSWDGGKKTFHGAMGDSETTFMYLEYDGIAYAEGDIFRSVSLGYKDGSCMNIYLPKSETENAVEIAERLSPTELAAAMDMEYADAFVSISMPKFECEYNESLKETLQKMGMTDSFDDSLADFGGMLDLDTYDMLHISDVIHAAKLECNEKGTEAAAATIVEVDTEAIMIVELPIPIEFTADRPFIYEIKSPSGEILFAGVISGF